MCRRHRYMEGAYSYKSVLIVLAAVFSRVTSQISNAK
jgi:hypothetical protein